MVSTSLDVSSCQVVTKSSRSGARLTEQEVGHILDHCSVRGGARLVGGFCHLAEPISSRLVVTKDKGVKLKEMKSERPAAVAVEEACDEGVAKTEGNS